MRVEITAKRVLWAAAGLLAAGLLIAWSGIVNIGASTGHWAITDWFLHWAMRNTARTYAALTVEEPAIDQTGLVSAAGHYAGSCAVCHGAPGELPSPLMQAATPHAPDLSSTAPTYSDAELFWIIKHGVKFTGMPAWPAIGRDDEIRRMTSFVRRLPEMTAVDYRRLAYGASGAVAPAPSAGFGSALAECERCHADDGRDQPDIPVLAGQKAAYLREALEAFASGERPSAVMSAAAARVGPTLLRTLARHYSQLFGLQDVDPRVDPATPAGSLPTAASVVAQGLPQRDLPPCAKCHAPGKRSDYPILAGQKASYLAARLRRWRSDEEPVEALRSDEPMPVIARRIPEHLIGPLARHFEVAGGGRGGSDSGPATNQ